MKSNELNRQNECLYTVYNKLINLRVKLYFDILGLYLCFVTEVTYLIKFLLYYHIQNTIYFKEELS